MKPFFWSTLDRFGYQVLNFLIFVILARLLSPEEFGTVAIVSSIIYILNIFIDGGFGITIIRNASISSEEVSTIFYSNIIISTICYAILFMLSRTLADFFNDPYLKILIRISGLVLFLNAIGLVKFALIEQKQQFKVSFLINIASLVIAGVSAITLAYFNYGVWSLVIMNIILSIIRTILYQTLGPTLPLTFFNFHLFRKNWTFSRNILLSSLIEALYQNGFTLLLGKLFKPLELGFFYNAKKVQETPTLLISGIMRRSFLPIFANKLKNEEDLFEGFRKVVHLVSFISFPFIMFLFFFSKEIFLLLYGHKWLPSVPYFQLLVLGGLFYALYFINLDIYKVKGDSKTYLYLNLYSKLFGIALIVMLIPFGMKYIIVGLIVSSYLSYLLAAYYTSKTIAYSFVTQLKTICPYLIITICDFVLMSSIRYFNIENVILEILIEAVLGFFTYYFLCEVFKLVGLKLFLKMIYN